MDKDEEENEVEISFIDFRPLLLQNKFQALIAKNSVHDEMKICMNHLEIARFIDSIYDEEKNYPVDEIDNHKILRTLISYQFNEYSKPYFLALRVMFIFGYFFPLIA